MGMDRFRSFVAAAWRERLLLLTWTLTAVIIGCCGIHETNEKHLEVLVIVPAVAAILVWYPMARMFREITTSRMELADQHRQFEAMFMDAAIGMCLTDDDGHFIRANPSFCQMVGYSEDELRGRSFAEFTHPDDRERNVRNFEALGDGGGAIEHEKRYVVRDGSVIWVLISSSAVSEGTMYRGLRWAQVRDITARRQGEQLLRESEERWRTLVANSQEMVLLLDEERRFAYVNPAVKRWLGYEPDTLIGSALGFATHPDDAAAVNEAFEQIASEESVSLRHRLRHQDGSWHTLESTLVAVTDAPAIGAVLITSRDVTERVALDQDRERLELDRRVSQRLEAVGQLAAGIAHEINTPLQFVGDSLTFLKEAADELVTLTGLYRNTLYTDAPIPVEERRRAMQQAEEDADVDYLCERIPAAFARTADGIDRMRSIVLAMKRFSHASNTDAALADINEAIETTLAVCRNEYKYVANVVVELGELPPIACNVGELNQVFLNLIINAAQAIEEKVAGSGEQGQIRISTRLDEGNVLIEIADDGAGIAPELQDRIYEPFFTTKQVGKGTGQGLALARTTIERHSGSLECASAPGQGTTFAIRLPLQESSTPVAEAA